MQKKKYPCTEPKTSVDRTLSIRVLRLASSLALVEAKNVGRGKGSRNYLLYFSFLGSLVACSFSGSTLSKLPTACCPSFLHLHTARHNKLVSAQPSLLEISSHKVYPSYFDPEMATLSPQTSWHHHLPTIRKISHDPGGTIL